MCQDQQNSMHTKNTNTMLVHSKKFSSHIKTVIWMYSHETGTFISAAVGSLY